MVASIIIGVIKEGVLTEAGAIIMITVHTRNVDRILIHEVI